MKIDREYLDKLETLNEMLHINNKKVLVSHAKLYKVYITGLPININAEIFKNELEKYCSVESVKVYLTLKDANVKSIKEIKQSEAII